MPTSEDLARAASRRRPRATLTALGVAAACGAGVYLLPPPLNWIPVVPGFAAIMFLMDAWLVGGPVRGVPGGPGRVSDTNAGSRPRGP